MTFRVILVWILWSMVAHAEEEEFAPDEEVDENEFRVASPQQGAVIVSGSMPVLVRLPMALRFHEPALAIDGVALENAPAVVRRRWWKGKGVDLVAFAHACTLPTLFRRFRSTP